ncbi:hypothetical protein ACJX0J_030222, partial [Zea mays]
MDNRNLLLYLLYIKSNEKKMNMKGYVNYIPNNNVCDIKQKVALISNNEKEDRLLLYLSHQIIEIRHKKDVPIYHLLLGTYYYIVLSIQPREEKASGQGKGTKLLGEKRYLILKNMTNTRHMQTGSYFYVDSKIMDLSMY